VQARSAWFVPRFPGRNRKRCGSAGTGDPRRRRHHAPVFVADAQGAVVEDVDGNRFIDLGAGIAVVNVGHAHPRVVEAVTAQAARFLHTCFQVTPYEGYVEVCEQLAMRSPGTTRSAPRSSTRVRKPSRTR
jgi:4-aminobutyrate aminotransferase-like enzyme